MTEVARRDPEIVVASWCGKRVDLDAIRQRPGWEAVSAVRAERVYALPSEDLLSPGPSLVVGLRALHDIVQDYVATPSRSAPRASPISSHDSGSMM